MPNFKAEIYLIFMDYSLLIKEAADYLDKYMDTHDLSMLRFHNGIHVKEVVEATGKMAHYYQLDERDTAIVLLSAHFHDIGYCGKGREGHEKRGADMAEDFLREKNA